MPSLNYIYFLWEKTWLIVAVLAIGATLVVSCCGNDAAKRNALSCWLFGVSMQCLAASGILFSRIIVLTCYQHSFQFGASEIMFEG